MGLLAQQLICWQRRRKDKANAISGWHARREAQGMVNKLSNAAKPPVKRPGSRGLCGRDQD